MSDAARPLPVVVLISGTGSNLRAIAAQAVAGTLPVAIRAVISDRADSAGLAWARDAGITTVTLSPRDFPDRPSYDRALAEAVARFEPGLVVLAGFMRILGPEFVDRFAGRLVNIHPSLLPAYRGLHTHRRVLEAGDPVHGASVHFVTRELDGGPVVLQARVPVRDDDDEATLSARVLAEEHRIYPECIGWFAANRLQLRGGVVMLDGQPLLAPMIREAQDVGHA
jgi:phosphoribosylglycinamide formyltransferase-1